MRHAVRIAHYLYQNAYLSGASAVLLGPTSDGRLFLSARRKQRTRIMRLLALEDICSVLELPAADKYKGTMERVARAVRPLSTFPSEDGLIIMKRALFAWLIADGDMHLKNMALLKIAEPGANQFYSVRMAPLYDAVTTRVFPNLKHDRMALKLNGKDHNLRRADFRMLATTAGLRAGDADAAIDEMLGRLTLAVEHLALPQSVEISAEVGKMVDEVLGLCRSRISQLTP